MNDIPFHQTRMGQQYYERTLPEIARQLARVADATGLLADIEIRRAACGASSESGSQSAAFVAGATVVIRFNPHDEEAADILGIVSLVQPGAGFMSSDLVHVRYQHPRDGSTQEWPFAAYNLEAGDRDSLIARAQRHEEQAARLRGMADRLPN
jgi:hypothetical protein